MLNSIAIPYESFDHLTSSEVHARLSAIIGRCDCKAADFHHRIENLRAFLQLVPQLSPAHRLDLVIQLHDIAQRTRQGAPAPAQDRAQHP